MSLKPIEQQSNIQQAIGYLKDNRPLRAEELCRDYLNQHPGCAHHLRLLANALAVQKRLAEAETTLRDAIQLEPQFPHLYEDLGGILAQQSQFNDAVTAFQKAIELQPSLPNIHKKLGVALAALGHTEEADNALQEFIDQDENRALLTQGMQHQQSGDHDAAFAAYRKALKNNPNDINALRCLAIANWQITKNFTDAEALLRRAVQITPHFFDGWQLLGELLLEQQKYAEAIKSYQKSVKLKPDNTYAWAGLGNAFSRSMQPEQGAEAFAKSLALKPDAPHVQMAYAHELKTLGDQTGALQAYRKAIALKPNFGEVYWSMANLKIFRFEKREVSNILHQLQQDDLAETSAIHFHFSAGKALEDQGDFEQAWHHYHTGNQKQRMLVQYDPMDMSQHQKAIKKTFNKSLLERIDKSGYEAPDPIFIVGLPRSGSTLVEQILASHSLVEGTSELPLINKITESMGRYRNDGKSYPEIVNSLRLKDFRAYGKQYIGDAQIHRTTDKPFFTDKLPNNFVHIGLIHAILPNAKFINARRHPFDSCLGGYKQLFGRGQNFTYDMLDLAHYYRQYDAMMKHWHEVLPGKILDLHYEETVTDIDAQVRRILSHCKLEFEEKCLRFYETERAVKTASSEQVRQPIYTGALGKWRDYENHLDLWKAQLGHIIDELPETVQNAGLKPPFKLK